MTARLHPDQLTRRRQLKPRETRQATLPMTDAHALLEARNGGATIGGLARLYGTTWNVVSRAITMAELAAAPVVVLPARPIVGQCFGCTCNSHDCDFEIEPLTSRLIRKPGTCRGGSGR